MDWSGCEDVIYVSGVPLVRGAEVSADELLGELKAGMIWGDLAKRHSEISKSTLESVLRYGAERLAFDEPSLVDWSGCSLVERIPGKLSGAPVLKGTRLRADTIVSNYEAGSPIAEIAENYPSASVDTIKALLAYAHGQQAKTAA